MIHRIVRAKKHRWSWYDAGSLLKSFDIREIIKDAGFKFLGRGIEIQP
jgi:hypothetical protein